MTSKAFGHKAIIVESFLLTLALLIPLSANAIFPEDEYQERIKTRQTITPLGDNPFGESVDPQSGALSFNQTDIVLEGTGLPIVLQRAHEKIGVAREAEVYYGFGDWGLNVPRITTLIPVYPLRVSPKPPASWIVNGSNMYARCTNFGPPRGGYWYDPIDWWRGIQISTPEGGTQEVLSRSSANTLAPSGLTFNGTAITSFPGVTTQHWMLGCGVPTTNEVAGREGFLVVSPAGVKYEMSWITYRAASGIIVPDEMPLQSSLGRKMAHLLVTRAEDRFGNWLNYTYSGDLLTDITASDGRHVVITWRNDLTEPVISRIDAVTPNSGTRTWNYSYAQAAEAYTGTPRTFLSGMTLPDGKVWQFNLAELTATRPMYPTGGQGATCDGNGLYLPDPTNYGLQSAVTMTHPSGLVGTYTVGIARHGRSYVHHSCWVSGGGRYSMGDSNIYDSPTLLGKSLTDNGTLSTWTYDYGWPVASWSKDCAAGCPSTTTTTVTEPDGSRIGYIVNNKYGDASEGKVEGTEIYDAGVSAPLSRSWITYAAPNAGPYPYPIGTLMHVLPNQDSLASLMPISKKRVTQFYDTYNWQVLAFDRYGAATEIRRNFSTQAVHELVTYSSDDAAFQSQWLLGQVKQVDNQTMSKTVSRTVFNDNALPQDRYAFGLKVMSYTWNAQGQLETFKDGLNRTTMLSDYKLGIPRLITFADSTTTSLEVSDFGEVNSITDENGATTSYQYDFMGRLSRTDYPTGDVVAWLPTLNEYFVDGANVVRTTIGRRRITASLDAYWRPYLTEDLDTTTGVVTYSRKSYDYKGNVTFESYPSTNSVSTAGIIFSHDALGRLTSRTTTDGVVLEQIYYMPGNRRHVTDADGRTTIVTYQAFDSPEYTNPIRIEAPENRTTVYQRDVYGKVLSATQSGNWSGGFATATRTWAYDYNERLCRMTAPETLGTVYGFDAASQIIWEGKGQTGTGCVQIKPSVAPFFTYDARGRKIKDDYPGVSDDVIYTYDLAGNRKTVTNFTAAWTYSYNKRNLVELEQAALDSKTFVVDPTYDAQGHLLQKALPDGTVISYSPDAWGRPTQLSGYVTGVQYYPTGSINSYSLGNSMTFTQTLDSRMRPFTQETRLGSNPIQRFVYSYTPAGDINAVSEQIDGVDGATYTYDGSHRISTATGLWGTYNYVYDTLNNIRSRSGPNALTYTYGANRLIRVSGGANRAYSYNTSGDIILDGTNILALNALGQVKRFGSTATYEFDGNGKRIKTTKGGLIEYALYDREGAMVYSEVGTTKTSYLGLPGRALVELNNVSGTITPTYLHPDWLGSPRKASNASGTILWSESFDPFGKKLNGVIEKVGYTGHAYDAESGLTYAQARYYDPVVGRFLSPDPVRMADDFNLYAYVGNNPINATDPTGLETAMFQREEYRMAAPSDYTATNVAIDFIPVIGDIKGFAEAYQNPSATNVIAAVIGLAGPIGDTVGKGLKQGSNIAENVAKGKAGEAITRSNLGEKVAGEQVTFKTSDGTRTRTDFVTTDKGVVETKTGGATLSSGQTKLKVDIEAGRPVIPVGQNAANAGLKPGEPTKMLSCVVDRPC